MIEGRDYQLEAIEQLRANIRDGMRQQVLCAPTGAGKTIMAAIIIEGAIKKNARVAFVADRQALVHQTSRRLHDAGLEHGVTMANSTHNRSSRVQVCSAQTMEKRGLVE